VTGGWVSRCTMRIAGLPVRRKRWMHATAAILGGVCLANTACKPDAQPHRQMEQPEPVAGEAQEPGPAKPSVEPEFVVARREARALEYPASFSETLDLSRRRAFRIRLPARSSNVQACRR